MGAVGLLVLISAPEAALLNFSAKNLANTQSPLWAESDGTIRPKADIK